MSLHCFPLGLLLLEEALPQLPLGKLEYVSLVVLETAIIWVLWKALLEKGKLLEELLREQMKFLGQAESVLERIERHMDSSSHSAK